MFDTETPAVNQTTANVVRLLSSPAINTAGLLVWAREGYVAERRRGGAVASFIAVFGDGYALGTVLAERLLRGETNARIVGDEVELYLTEEEARLLRSCQQAAERDPTITVCLR